jgi:hypothetical protein
MIWTHVFYRVACVWRWEWLTAAAWGSLAHYRAGLVIACVASGGAVLWGIPPASPSVPAPLIDVGPGPAGGLPDVEVPTPEPGSLVVLMSAVVVLGLLRRVTSLSKRTITVVRSID